MIESSWLLRPSLAQELLPEPEKVLDDDEEEEQLAINQVPAAVKATILAHEVTSDRSKDDRNQDLPM